jgi:hypothetical protein
VKRPDRKLAIAAATLMVAAAAAAMGPQPAAERGGSRLDATENGDSVMLGDLREEQRVKPPQKRLVSWGGS